MDDNANKGVMDLFMKYTGEKFESIEKRFDTIEVTLEDLKQIKWQQVGRYAILNIIISGIVAIATAWISTKGVHSEKSTGLDSDLGNIRHGYDSMYEHTNRPEPKYRLFGGAAR